MHRVTKKTVAIVAGTLLVAAGAGVAYAYWTAGGTGDGTATTGTSTDLTVNQVTVVTPMFPGDAPQTLSGTFNNTSSGPIHVASVTVSIDSVTQGAVTAVGCSAADYTVSGAIMAAVQNVPTGANKGTWTGATIQFNNTTSNQDACKNAVVHLHYVVG
jgi:hypothetical protein